MASALTAEVPDSAASGRPGAIVLARHGEPALSRQVKLSAAQYRDFWAKYEVLGILPGQTPPDALARFVDKAGTLLSSTRLRSVESARVLAPGRKVAEHEVLIEAPLPPPALPAWIRLSPRIWGFLARFWWWFFNHHDGQETRAAAERRADQAAAMLIDHALRGEDVVVLAHGFFNFMISRALRKRGWKQVSRVGYKYWSTRRFERA
ncbi:MAG: hypothetical protein JWP73_770 [Phenylobacterium sp.]|nr:hypothetical protein [Phenylobacterium sp.]